jgi:hypothetical protein
MNETSSLVTGIFSALFAKEVLTLALTSLSVAAVTFGFLDLFMNPGVKPKKTVIETDRREKAAWLLIAVTCIPFSLVIIGILSAMGIIGKGINVDFTAILICIITSITLGWIFSFGMRKNLTDAEKIQYKGQWLLIGAAWQIVLDKILERLAAFGNTLVSGTWYIMLSIVHKRYIVNYFTTSMVLNLTFSFVLLYIMGSTAGMAAANLIGSSIAGVLHYTIRRNKINELKLKYTRTQEVT